MLERLIAAALFTLVLSACRRPLSEKERMVVGTWDSTGMEFHGAHPFSFVY